MNTFNLPNFNRHDLGDGLAFFEGRLPEHLMVDNTRFAELWALHPAEYHVIRMVGKPVPTPRFQQAYGSDYHYTGRVNKALPIPSNLQPFLFWACEQIYPQINGMLLNWYDGLLGHYIGKHRDSTVNMIHGAPIVTISFGEQRVFRLRRWRGQGFRDFQTALGSVFVMPFETNRRWTHEVLKGAKYRGQRISVTLRAFTSE